MIPGARKALRKPMRSARVAVLSARYEALAGMMHLIDDPQEDDLCVYKFYWEYL